VALLTSLVVLSSFFVIAGPQGAGAAPPSSRSAASLEFTPIGSQLNRLQTDDRSFTVYVAAKRRNGTIATDYTDQISLTIEFDPGENEPGNLRYGGPVTPVNGIATFSGVSLGEAGTAYRLEACSPTVNESPCPATGLEDGLGFLSPRFDVFNARSACPSPCFVAATGDTGDDVESAAVSSNATSGEIRAGIWEVLPAVPGGSDPDPLANLDCPSYDEITTHVVNVEQTGSGSSSGSMIVTVTISTEAMKAIADQGVAHLETCHASTTNFVTKFGPRHIPSATFNETLGLWVGLLPNCPQNWNSNDFPCNISRMGGGGGTGQITYGVKESDPAGRN
jgi:hypothetical protein